MSNITNINNNYGTLYNFGGAQTVENQNDYIQDVVKSTLQDLMPPGLMPSFSRHGFPSVNINVGGGGWNGAGAGKTDYTHDFSSVNINVGPGARRVNVDIDPNADRVKINIGGWNGDGCKPRYTHDPSASGIKVNKTDGIPREIETTNYKITLDEKEARWVVEDKKTGERHIVRPEHSVGNGMETWGDPHVNNGNDGTRDDVKFKKDMALKLPDGSKIFVDTKGKEGGETYTTGLTIWDKESGDAVRVCGLMEKGDGELRVSDISGCDAEKIFNDGINGDDFFEASVTNKGSLASMSGKVLKQHDIDELERKASRGKSSSFDDNCREDFGSRGSDRNRFGSTGLEAFGHFLRGGNFYDPFGPSTEGDSESPAESRVRRIAKADPRCAELLLDYCKGNLSDIGMDGLLQLMEQLGIHDRRRDWA